MSWTSLANIVKLGDLLLSNGHVVGVLMVSLHQAKTQIICQLGASLQLYTIYQ